MIEAQWESVLSYGNEQDNTVPLTNESHPFGLMSPPRCRHSVWGDRYLIAIWPKGRIGIVPPVYRQGS